MNSKEITTKIIPAIKILTKKYNSIDKTTLNRMRTLIPKEVRLFPGHGLYTTMGHELLVNERIKI